MWIDRIVLKNYRQYRNSAIDFAPPGREGFTVIEGANGSGKTNILNAITWCLYGKEHHLARKSAGLPIYHAGTAEQLKKGESSSVEVELTLREDGGNKIIITRSLRFLSSGAGKISFIPDPSSPGPDGSRISLVRQIRKDMSPVPDPQFVAQKLIPEEIENYFLFDGERLDNYFQETSGQQIHDAVFNISQLGLLERLIEHLQREQRDFLQDLKGLSPKAEQAKASLEIYRQSVERGKSDLEDLKRQKLEADKTDKELTERLKAIAPENIGKLQSQREQLDSDLEHLERNISGWEKELRGLLISS